MIRALPTRPLALTLSLVAVAAAGCGSSSKSKTAPPAASTPATPSTPATSSTGTGTTAGPGGAFSAQLNALCKQGNQEAKSATTVQQGAAIAEKLLPKFEALTPPAALKATYAEFVANTKKEVTAAKAGDKATLGQLTLKDRALGSKLGAPECG